MSFVVFMEITGARRVPGRRSVCRCVTEARARRSGPAGDLDAAPALGRQSIVAAGACGAKRMAESIEVIARGHAEVVSTEDSLEEIARARIEIEEPSRERRATRHRQLVRCDERIVRDRTERRDGFDRT